jgi:hypothetical protein
VDDQTAIATAAGVTFASVAGNRLDHGDFPSGRLFASTCLAFAGLGLVAMASPDIGKGLAIGTAATAFVTMGLPVLIKYFPEQGTPEWFKQAKGSTLRSLNNPIADALARNGVATQKGSE